MKTDIVQILSSPDRDDKIRRLLDKGPWKHDWHKEYGRLHGEEACKKCKFPRKAYKELVRDMKHYQPCKFPDPIALDANLAFKMREELDKFQFAAALGAVASVEFKNWTNTDKYGKGTWLIGWLSSEAQPHHYILAAWMAGEAE